MYDKQTNILLFIVRSKQTWVFFWDNFQSDSDAAWFYKRKLCSETDAAKG